jgi:hypothetical protein
MVYLFATNCSCIAILWVSLVSFTAIILCVASQRVFIVVVYFVIDSVRKLLDTPSYCPHGVIWLVRWNVGRSQEPSGLRQWYSTGGTRRHLRGYIKFKISIHILFHEWSELQKNISFQSELVLFYISSVPCSTQQWNLAAVLVMLIILWSYNNECHLNCLFVSNAHNNSNAEEYTLLAQWIQFNIFQ